MVSGPAGIGEHRPATSEKHYLMPVAAPDKHVSLRLCEPNGRAQVQARHISEIDPNTQTKDRTQRSLT